MNLNFIEKNINLIVGKVMINTIQYVLSQVVALFDEILTEAYIITSPLNLNFDTRQK